MSQDLFAAFGDFTTSSKDQSNGLQTTSTAASRVEQPTEQVLIDDDDDFGDFEGAAVPLPQSTAPQIQRASPEKVKADDQPAKTISQAQPRLPFSPKPATNGNNKSTLGRHPFADHMDILFSADDDEYSAGQDEWNDLSNDPEAAMAYSKRVIQEQLDAEARAKRLPLQSPQAQPGVAQVHTQTQSKSRDPAVLFDAEDLSEGETSDVQDGDDWGDFEDTSSAQTAATQSVPKQTTPVLSGTTTASQDLLGLDEPSLQPPTSSVAVKKSFESPRPPRAAPVLSSSPVDDDPWDDFDNVSKQAPLPVAAASTTKEQAVAKSSKPSIPPTNIPPPSVILSLLGSKLKTEPSPDSAPGLVNTVWVSAHVLAGRKLRWKRSTTLAASMRIGPAAAGGKSGMKLTGVDRGEVSKEDREVAELLAVWSARVGKLRTAVASYNHALGAQKLSVQRLPELAPTIPVKTLKPIEGGFSAPHECALCGLKREERLAKTDENIEDNFGEWWIDQASMHTKCTEWWVENELVLRSR